MFALRTGGAGIAFVALGAGQTSCALRSPRSLFTLDPLGDENSHVGFFTTGFVAERLYFDQNTIALLQESIRKILEVLRFGLLHALLRYAHIARNLDIQRMGGQAQHNEQAKQCS